MAKKFHLLYVSSPFYGYVHMVLAEFSTGCKLLLETSFTKNRSIFFLHSHRTDVQVKFITVVRGFAICPCTEHYFSKNDFSQLSYHTSTCNHAFAKQKLRWLYYSHCTCVNCHTNIKIVWCSHPTCQIFNPTIQKFGLDISV